jgi:tRNA G18 (ribose-2'-O)-methylase SpoU
MNDFMASDYVGFLPSGHVELETVMFAPMIVGGEAKGASPAARQLATEQVFIPMPGGSESLNAAVAGAVLMFEVLRQRSTS